MDCRITADITVADKNSAREFYILKIYYVFGMAIAYEIDSACEVYNSIGPGVIHDKICTDKNYRNPCITENIAKD